MTKKFRLLKSSGHVALACWLPLGADIAVRRDFYIAEKVGMQFRAEAFNLLNHAIFGSVYSLLNNGPEYFGKASNTLNNQLAGLSALYQVGGSRSLQLALRLHF